MSNCADGRLVRTVARLLVLKGKEVVAPINVSTIAVVHGLVTVPEPGLSLLGGSTGSRDSSPNPGHASCWVLKPHVSIIIDNKLVIVDDV